MNPALLRRQSASFISRQSRFSELHLHPVIIKTVCLVLFSLIYYLTVSSLSPHKACPSTDDTNRCSTRLPTNFEFVTEFCKGLYFAKTDSNIQVNIV